MSGLNRVAAVAWGCFTLSSVLMSQTTEPAKPADPAAAVKAQPADPKDRETVVISVDNCSLMRGTNVLVAVPSRTVLTVLGTQTKYLQVQHENQIGWIQETQCIHLGKNPPSAEGFCRKGLDALSGGDLPGARLNFFIAGSIDPQDQSYKGFFDSLTLLADEVKKGVDLYETANGKMDEAKKKAEDANFLAKSKGFEGKGSLGGGSMGKKDDGGRSKAAEAQQSQAEAKQNLEYMAKVAKNLEELMRIKIDGYMKDGLLHMALALADFKRSILKMDYYAFWVKSGAFTILENLEPIRQVVADSNKQCTAGLDARKAGQYAKASEAFHAALSKWPKNKLAKEGETEVNSMLERFGTKQREAQTLLRDGRLVDLEEFSKDLAPVPAEFEMLASAIAQGHKTLQDSRDALQAGEKAFADNRLLDAALGVDRAARAWKMNPDSAKLAKTIMEKDPKLMEDFLQFSKSCDALAWPDAIATLQKLQASYATSTSVAQSLGELQEKQKTREAEHATAKELETALKLTDAFEIYKKQNYKEDITRLAAELAKSYEKQQKWERAVAFYEESGLVNDAKRVRQAHGVFGEVSALMKEKTGTEVFDENANRVCLILVPTAQGAKTGTGFLVSKLGHIVTNNHVVDETAQNVKVRFPDEKIWRPATIVKSIKKPDLALIKIDPANLKSEPVKVARGLPKVGTKVYALGFPYIAVAKEDDAAVHSSFTDGTVSNADRTVMEMPCIQTTATINHGNSGGPLFDSYGRVVGVNTLVLITDDQLKDVFFAIRVDEVWKNLLTGITVNAAAD